MEVGRYVEVGGFYVDMSRMKNSTYNKQNANLVSGEKKNGANKYGQME